MSRPSKDPVIEPEGGLERVSPGVPAENGGVQEFALGDDPGAEIPEEGDRREDVELAPVVRDEDNPLPLSLHLGQFVEPLRVEDRRLPAEPLENPDCHPMDCPVVALPGGILVEGHVCDGGHVEEIGDRLQGPPPGEAGASSGDGACQDGSEDILRGGREALERRASAEWPLKGIEVGPHMIRADRSLP